MQTLDQVLETALQLPYEQQEMLIKILQNRSVENRREEIARDASKTLDDFRKGKLKSQLASESITELRDFLTE